MMLILNLFAVIGFAAALKGRDIAIERRQATAAKQYTVYTINQPVCYFPCLEGVSAVNHF
jgi:hypothetical protein